MFWVYVAFFVLVVYGTIPRSLVIYATGILALYFALASTEDALIFFVRAIPIFIAIPLTANYDNPNIWPIFSIIIFLKWFFAPATLKFILQEFRVAFKKPWDYAKKHQTHVIFHLLTVLAILSLWHAPDRIVGLKRIVYFINASLIGLVIYWQDRGFIQRLIRNIKIPLIIVVVAGVIQLVTTYMMDIYQFVDLWGYGIQLRQFGSQWSYIATHVGNTWFAYFGDQLSLRVFSLFPDSHSFPIFLLLGLPAFFLWALEKPLAKAESFKNMLRTRGRLNILWIPLIFLMVILSGTRGFWAAAVGVILWTVLLWLFMRWQKVAKAKINTFKYLASFIAIFVLMFSIAYPIFSSPQFLVSKLDARLLQNRIRSVLDFGETSNAQRLDIWHKSLVSISHHPVFGVGIGNFPVVLGQDINLARAGSSAHNIYLHIAAEMGVLALLATLYLVWLIIKSIYLKFMANEYLGGYFGGLLLTIPWILLYLLTDVALFDERALLMFVTTLAIIFHHDGK